MRNELTRTHIFTALTEFHALGMRDISLDGGEPLAHRSVAALPDGRIFLESDPDPYEQGRPDIRALHAAAHAAGIERSIDCVRASRALIIVETIAGRIDSGQESELTRGGSRKQASRAVQVLCRN